MRVEVAAEVLAGGIFDAVAELNKVGLLSHHIDHDISGQALGTVIEPLDDISIDQRGHPNRLALIVDLGILAVTDLKLGNQIAVRADAAQRTAAQLNAGVLIQHGDLAVGDLRHVLGEVAAPDIQQVIIGAGTEDGRTGQCAHHADRQNNTGQKDRHLAGTRQRPGKLHDISRPARTPAPIRVQTE